MGEMGKMGEMGEIRAIVISLALNRYPSLLLGW